MLLRTIPAILTLSATLLLGACASAPAPIPPLGPVLPATAERSAWIEQALARDTVASTVDKAIATPSTDALVAELREERKLPVGDDYWALYKQNMETLRADMLRQKQRVRAAYVVTYTDQLNRADDQTLQRLASAPDKLDKATSRAWTQRMVERFLTYMQADNKGALVTLDAHLQRMALMDRQYKICQVYSNCWDKPLPK
ncbi:hypothetical protein [Pseudomonas sp. UFMG81]|uniref:hypothetical protein n=1 Tax=Pseudomonas sp. UFMG81 TaxID=2745936 RepID=UPI0018906F76|nr:hypothetical protein [Pseudomonas sp. UFMG81]